MKTKVCITCGKRKPLASYYVHPAMADGRLGRCRTCHRAAMRSVRLANINRYRAYDRLRSQTPERKAMFADKQRRARAAPPEQERARRAVAYAIKAGKLVRPSLCEMCGASGSIHAHHDDHRRKLDVRWLCPACHAQRHYEPTTKETQ